MSPELRLFFIVCVAASVAMFFSIIIGHSIEELWRRNREADKSMAERLSDFFGFDR